MNKIAISEIVNNDELILIQIIRETKNEKINILEFEGRFYIAIKK